MAKAILEFNISDPEDGSDFTMAINGHKFARAISEMDQWLRGKIKYPEEDVAPEAIDAYDECRQELRRILSEAIDDHSPLA